MNLRVQLSQQPFVPHQQKLRNNTPTPLAAAAAAAPHRISQQTLPQTTLVYMRPAVTVPQPLFIPSHPQHRHHHPQQIQQAQTYRHHLAQHQRVVQFQQQPLQRATTPTPGIVQLRRHSSIQVVTNASPQKIQPILPMRDYSTAIPQMQFQQYQNKTPAAAAATARQQDKSSSIQQPLPSFTPRTIQQEYPPSTSRSVREMINGLQSIKPMPPASAPQIHLNNPTTSREDIMNMSFSNQKRVKTTEGDDADQQYRNSTDGDQNSLMGQPDREDLSKYLHSLQSPPKALLNELNRNDMLQQQHLYDQQQPAFNYSQYGDITASAVQQEQKQSLMQHHNPLNDLSLSPMVLASQQPGGLMNTTITKRGDLISGFNDSMQDYYGDNSVAEVLPAINLQEDVSYSSIRHFATPTQQRIAQPVYQQQTANPITLLHRQFNNSSTEFIGTPERSREAVSCVFINPSDKKVPSRIKIKYTPAEQLSARRNEQNNMINSNAGLNSSLSFLAASIDFLQTAARSSPEKRVPIQDILSKIDADPLEGECQ